MCVCTKLCIIYVRSFSYLVVYLRVYAYVQVYFYVQINKYICACRLCDIFACIHRSAEASLVLVICFGTPSCIRGMARGAESGLSATKPTEDLP